MAFDERVNTLPPGDVPTLPANLRGYCEARQGWGQVLAVLALLEGLKPAMDDWIPVSRWNSFVQWVQEQGLLWLADSCFEFVSFEDLPHDVVGRSTLNTTRAIGRPPGKSETGSVHVFLSRDRNWLKKAADSGWYPLVNEGRVSEKPWIDHHHFGESLGYPSCCRYAFAQHNDWNSNNSLYHALSEAQEPLAVCNSLMKHSGLSYSVHLPCRFDCPETAHIASQVRQALHDASKSFGRYVDELVASPYLVLSEWEAFGFRGSCQSNDTITYDAVWVAPSNQPNLSLFADLQRGDKVQVREDLIVVCRGSTLLGIHTTRVDRFGPQVPMIAQFSL